MMELIGNIFTPILLEPMINFLVILNNVLFGSFGLGIIAFTIVVRLLTWPLTLRQLHQTRAMQNVQPRIQEINKKYSDPKRRQEELMKVYKESGVNPIGCLGPMILQFPILIALFYAIRAVLPESPEALERLADHLYSWNYIQHAIPIREHFLGFDLRTSNYVLVAGVALTTWAQTKTTVMSATADDRTRAQQQMMAYMMPLMFGFFALSFPSGVSLYWVVNSLVGIAFNIAVYGLPIAKIKPLVKGPTPAPSTQPPGGSSGGSPSARIEPARELRTANGVGRSKRQNRRRRP
ncbi:MAG: YidC/Oxa1 family membrane protein insertase [Dehalococcoidia bacterium]